MVEKSFLVINGKTVGLGGKIPAKNVTYSNVDTDLKSIDVQNAIDEVYAKSIKASEKGQANGVASLNLMGVIPSEQLNVTGLDVKGTWDASTNTPLLANGNGESGDFYIVNVAGSANFGAGEIDFAVGDWVLYTANGTWVKSVNASAVQSVNGKTGVVNILDTDVLNEAQIEAVNSEITKAKVQQIETNKTHISETNTNLETLSTQVTTNKAEIDAKINEILYHGRYTDIYVDYQNGNDSNDGLSEATPRKTVPDDEFIARFGNNIFVRINLMSNYDGVISLPATDMTAIVIRKAENIDDEIVVNGHIDTVHTNTVIQNLTINGDVRCVGISVGFCYISNCNLTTTASLGIIANQSTLTITDCNISATNILRLTNTTTYISATKSVSLSGNLIAGSSFSAIANIATNYITTTGLTYDTDVIPVFVNGKLRAVESLIDDVSAMNDAILENKNSIANIINDTDLNSKDSTLSADKIVSYVAENAAPTYSGTVIPTKIASGATVTTDWNISSAGSNADYGRLLMLNSKDGTFLLYVKGNLGNTSIVPTPTLISSIGNSQSASWSSSFELSASSGKLRIKNKSGAVASWRFI